jgi:hypothetical protein
MNVLANLIFHPQGTDGGNKFEIIDDFMDHWEYQLKLHNASIRELKSGEFHAVPIAFRIPDYLQNHSSHV